MACAYQESPLPVKEEVTTGAPSLALAGRNSSGSSCSPKPLASRRSFRFAASRATQSKRPTSVSGRCSPPAARAPKKSVRGVEREAVEAVQGAQIHRGRRQERVVRELCAQVGGCAA
jgi:hypothetical protein